MKKGWRKYTEVGPKTGYTANSALVTNYEKAKADNFEGWSIHHRLETHDENGFFRDKPVTIKELKEKGLYYNRPASELIWLRKSDHSLLHMMSGGFEPFQVKFYEDMLKFADELYGELEWTMDEERIEEYEQRLDEEKLRVLYLKTLGNPDQLQKPLDDSTSKLFQLKVCLDVLHEAKVDCDLVQKLYDREMARNKRLTKLVIPFCMMMGMVRASTIL